MMTPEAHARPRRWPCRRAPPRSDMGSRGLAASRDRFAPKCPAPERPAGLSSLGHLAIAAGGWRDRRGSSAQLAHALLASIPDCTLVDGLAHGGGFAGLRKPQLASISCASSLAGRASTTSIGITASMSFSDAGQSPMVDNLMARLTLIMLIVISRCLAGRLRQALRVRQGSGSKLIRSPFCFLAVYWS